RQAPSKPVARTVVRARASKCQRYGWKSHDQPSTSPASIVSITTGPRPGTYCSSATLPWRRTQKASAGAAWRKSVAPASTCTCPAHPARSAIRSGPSPSRNGVSASTVSSERTDGLLRGADRGDLLGDVDPDRAPRDAPAAADAAGRAELVVPRP